MEIGRMAPPKGMAAGSRLMITEAERLPRGL
jgi:hypothetical protein